MGSGIFRSSMVRCAQHSKEPLRAVHIPRNLGAEQLRRSEAALIADSVKKLKTTRRDALRDAAAQNKCFDRECVLVKCRANSDVGHRFQPVSSIERNPRD